ncbi:MAG: hypothetical protein ACLP5H_25535 [Desulfomonilaceae bacterium]
MVQASQGVQGLKDGSRAFARYSNVQCLRVPLLLDPYSVLLSDTLLRKRHVHGPKIAIFTAEGAEIADGCVFCAFLPGQAQPYCVRDRAITAGRYHVLHLWRLSQVLTECRIDKTGRLAHIQAFVGLKRGVHEVRSPVDGL